MAPQFGERLTGHHAAARRNQTAALRSAEIRYGVDARACFPAPRLATESTTTRRAIPERLTGESLFGAPRNQIRTYAPGSSGRSLRAESAHTSAVPASTPTTASAPAAAPGAVVTCTRTRWMYSAPEGSLDRPSVTPALPSVRTIRASMTCPIRSGVTDANAGDGGRHAVDASREISAQVRIPSRLTHRRLADLDAPSITAAAAPWNPDRRPAASTRAPRRSERDAPACRRESR